MRLTPLAVALAACTAAEASAPRVELASVAVTWQATCGTIGADGAYTAPSTPGTCLVVADTAGSADTAIVTVVAPPSGCVSSPTTICPGDNWQAKVEAAPSGTTFTVGAGTHWNQQVTPKSNDVFRGEAGAVMDGGRLLTGWASDGAGHWYLTGQTQQHSVASNPCAAGFPACNYPEDLWVDGTLLQRVVSLGAVTSTTWYFDYAADRIYVGLDPSGHSIVTSVTTHALSGSTSGVRIVGLTVRHYANNATTGCIAGTSWTVDSTDVSGCHGIGIKLNGSGMKMRWNHAHHNGQFGIAGSGGTGGLVYANEVDHNGLVGYEPGWGAGGSKFTVTTDLVIRQNHFHHNTWTGIWADINNTNTLIDSNRVDHEGNNGIMCEISWGCTVAANTADSNGTVATGAFQGSGILCSATADCHIHHNALHGNVGNGILLLQQDRSTDQADPRGEHLVTNANVHDNMVSATTGGNGFKGGYETTDFTLHRNNCFTSNAWFFPAGSAKLLNVGAAVSDATWQGSGCNAGETIVR